MVAWQRMFSSIVGVSAAVIGGDLIREGTMSYGHALGIVGVTTLVAVVLGWCGTLAEVKDLTVLSGLGREGPYSAVQNMSAMIARYVQKKNLIYAAYHQGADPGHQEEESEEYASYKQGAERRLASPNIESGLGSEQPGGVYTLVSTKAGANPGTVYWEAPFSNATIAGPVTGACR